MEARLLLNADPLSTDAPDGFAVPGAIGHVVSASSIPPALYGPFATGPLTTGPAVSGPYTPAQIRHAYGIDQLSLDGTGQTIGIVNAYEDPTIVSDLAAFDSRFGLPAPPSFVTTTPPDQTPPTGASSGWDLEIALDVEWAHAIAPGAKIVLVEAQDSSLNHLLDAVDYARTMYGADQISMSWGGDEFSGSTSQDSYFDHPGVTYLAASGDSGSGVEFPADSQYVTGIGGTSLSLDATGNILSETTWAGSGGGVSTTLGQPSYQNGFLSGSQRGVPDVAYNADPGSGVYVYENGSWNGVGGTGAGAPQWAGLIALVNQGRAALGEPSLGTGQALGTNALLYQLAGGTSYTNPGGDFHDITTGSNGTPATVGYDTATGLGSPAANKLVPDLIGSALAGTPNPTPATPSSGIIDDGDPGYATSGSWSHWTSQWAVQGYEGDVNEAAAGSGSSQAEWAFGGLAAGKYVVEATWPHDPNRATNAPYTLYDGSASLGTALVNQQPAPSGESAAGGTWQALGTYTVSSGTLRVLLTNQANGYVEADAIRVVPVAAAGPPSPLPVGAPNPAPASPASGIIDDGDPGYATSGSWSHWTSQWAVQGYEGDVDEAAAGSGSAEAVWAFGGLAPGQYVVEATWPHDPNRATNAPYTLYDGSASLGTALVNQQPAPSGESAAGGTWQALGTYTVSSGTLRVLLTNQANGYVEADAIRVVPVAAAGPPSPLPVGAPNPAPASPASGIIDDGDPGYATSGSWSHWTSQWAVQGYEGDVDEAAAGSGSAEAVWAFGGLAPGQYVVEATWPHDPNRATNAPYTLYDGSASLGTALVNQQPAPSGETAAGGTWQALGTYTVSSGTLRVLLTNQANGYVEADAIRVVPVAAAGPPSPLPVGAPNPAPASPASGIIDDGDPGYATSGSWSHWTSQWAVQGYEGDVDEAAAGSGSAEAVWAFGGLAPGQYVVEATWPHDPNRATDAPYTLYDGSASLGTALVNQQPAPSGESAAGGAWQALGTYTVSSGTLRVLLTNQANGYVEADAIRVVPVAGTSASSNTTSPASISSIPLTGLGSLPTGDGTPGVGIDTGSASGRSGASRLSGLAHPQGSVSFARRFAGRAAGAGGIASSRLDGDD